MPAPAGGSAYLCSAAVFLVVARCVHLGEVTQFLPLDEGRDGRFLNFITTVIKTNASPKDLTERGFRTHWPSSTGLTSSRFLRP
jgi:hypothetical protein